MPAPGCPSWQYSNHPERQSRLLTSVAAVLRDIQAGTYLVEDCARDTRPIHKTLFQFLTPKNHDYYAGNYRGDSRYRCLTTYKVHVSGDPLVASVALSDIETELARLGDEIVSGAIALETELKQLAAAVNPPYRLIIVVRWACAAFTSYLTVHPYVDGNGHTARALLWVLLHRFGYVPNLFTIDPRPSVPDYAQAIYKHRRGDREDLEKLIINSVSIAQPI